MNTTAMPKVVAIHHDEPSCSVDGGCLALRSSSHALSSDDHATKHNPHHLTINQSVRRDMRLPYRIPKVNKNSKIEIAELLSFDSASARQRNNF